MFRHKDVSVPEKERSLPADGSDEGSGAAPLGEESGEKDWEVLRGLVEQNLKWSQIIYEQNRKINRKLFWHGFFGWVKLAIVAVPIILAVVYLSPIVQSIWRQYGAVLRSGALIPGQSGNNSPEAVENIIKLLPLSPLQQEQLRQMLK